MPDLFTDGNQSSASALMRELEALNAAGQSVLDDIGLARMEALLDFQHELSALNARRQRAMRTGSPDVAARFLVSDFLEIDQAQTTATVRADSQAVSLRERTRPTDAVVRSTSFRSDKGTAESFGNFYRVHTDDSTTPTGVFDIEFTSALAITLIVFDMVSQPSSPSITVEVSSNGVRYSQIANVARNGYRVNAWIPTQSVRFVRIRITPSHPDTLGGSSYTFGLTNLTASAVDFHLRSELVTAKVVAKPLTRKARFITDADPGLDYFLSFNGQTYFEVEPGTEVQFVGSDHEVNDVTLNNVGLLGYTLPAGFVPQSVRITDPEGVPYRIAPGLSEAAEGLTRSWICVDLATGALYLRPFNPATQSELKFTASCKVVPASVNVWLRVRLATNDRSVTPVFRGARMENI